MKMLVDREKLKQQITTDPDLECEAGTMHPKASRPCSSELGRTIHAHGEFYLGGFRFGPGTYRIIRMPDEQPEEPTF